MPIGGEAASTGIHVPANIIDVDNKNASAIAAAFITREDVKKQRELEEARKSGLLPAEKDEEGKDINPHIPQYIAKAPWYLSQDNRPSLKHQRYKDDHQSNIHKWYRRGLVSEIQKATIKYREGACENCGAISHKAKDCTERPRKKGAKWSGTDLRPDELITQDSQDLQLDFDGKRDRYGGYDPATYKLVVREFELVDEERRRRKALELQQGLKKDSRKGRKRRNLENNTRGGSDSDSDSDIGEDEDEEDVKLKDFDETNAPVNMKDDQTRTTMMNLRIREDTAKYLFNLDPNSAFYDPKTRSMRDNPLRHLKENEQGIYRGDNVSRNSGDANVVTKMEIFAWEGYKHNANIHTQAQPTQLELMHQEFTRKKQELIELKKKQLLERYAASDPLSQPELVSDVPLLSQSETYVEYSAVDGSVKVIRSKGVVRSMYQEDVYFGDHTQVWGSYFDRENRKWGYGCCHSLDRLKTECIEITESQ